MVKPRLNKAWSFEVEFNNSILKSWFYSDSIEDATDRLTNYIGAKIIKLEEIEDPLGIIKYDKSIKTKKE
jgi:hypothetical protein